jgi:hypothetical protein
MAANFSYNCWKVEIAGIPAIMTVSQLAQKIGVPTSHINLSEVQKNGIRYALIDDFVSEEESITFARQWSGSSIYGGTVECVVIALKDNKTDDLHSSRKSRVSGAEISPSKQHGFRIA